MLLREVLTPNDPKLVALAQYLTDRATDTGAKKTVDIETFINMASNMGVNITVDQLRDIATQVPLKNVILNVTDDQVVLKGAGESDTVTDTMTVDQAEDTVEKMAKRAVK